MGCDQAAAACGMFVDGSGRFIDNSVKEAHKAVGGVADTVVKGVAGWFGRRRRAWRQRRDRTRKWKTRRGTLKHHSFGHASARATARCPRELLGPMQEIPLRRTRDMSPRELECELGGGPETYGVWHPSVLRFHRRDFKFCDAVEGSCTSIENLCASSCQVNGCVPSVRARICWRTFCSSFAIWLCNTHERASLLPSFAAVASRWYLRSPLVFAA